MLPEINVNPQILPASKETDMQDLTGPGIPDGPVIGAVVSALF